MLRFYTAVVFIALFSIGCGKMVATPEVVVKEINPEIFVVADSSFTTISVTVRVTNDVEARALRAEFSFRKNDGSTITGVNNITRYIDVLIPTGEAGATALNSYPVPTVEIRNYLIANPTEQVYLNIRISGEDAYGYEKNWNCEGKISVTTNQ
ncbi:hypothetical protein JXL83_05395 [candidate division WOR-3 bacterium]|nr:hypothetical protein [candidate division WOR-3 bacterium]